MNGDTKRIRNNLLATSFDLHICLYFVDNTFDSSFTSLQSSWFAHAYAVDRFSILEKFFNIFLDGKYYYNQFNLYFITVQVWKTKSDV